MKRTIYHFNSSDTYRGRAINALLAFLTANRYSVIFSLKCTIVRRNYNPHRMKQRIIDNLVISTILLPFLLMLTMAMQECGSFPISTPEDEKDSVVCAPSQPTIGCIAHPHTHL